MFILIFYYIIQKAEVAVRITAYDAAKKITLIKEVRAFLGLGLKESKEFVDSIPVNLKEKVKREEALEIQEKFKDLCTIELV